MKLPYKSRVFKGYKPMKYLSDIEGYRVRSRYVYKYLPVSYLESIFEKGLRFCTPDMWIDKGDTRFFNADYSAINADFVKPYLLATCFTLNKQSEASWKGYIDFSKIDSGLKNEHEDILTIAQLKINRAKLRAELANFCVKNSETVIDIYEGVVCYVTTHAFLNCHCPNIDGAKSLYNSLFRNKGFELDDFLSVCLLKRREVFEHERELRYFLLLKEKSDEFFVDIDIKSVVEHIYLWRANQIDKISTDYCESVANKCDINPTIIEQANLYLNETGSMTPIKIVL